MFSYGVSVTIVIVLAILSLLLIFKLISISPNNNYWLFIVVFYFGALLFFGAAYLRQLNISYEARHFRIIGLLITPGVIYLVSRSKKGWQLLFIAGWLCISFFSFRYLIKGYTINKNLSARGASGISQINIDQQALNAVMKLDKENRNAIFVFIANDIGLEVLHNRVINLSPIGDDLKIDVDYYRYEGFAGPLYIVLPESYNGPKEKMIMKSFPGYAGFNLSMLSDKYVLYSAKLKR
jgi:hypothetical protein